MMFYIPFEVNTKIDYTFLFCLYKIAGKNQKQRLKNIIQYQSMKELAETIQSYCGFSVSQSTISRLLNKTEYHYCFDLDKKNKTITLKNDFRRQQGNQQTFVVLTEKEINFLINKNDELLTRYYLYLKFYCGASGINQTNATIEQILSAVGYNHKSGTNKGKCSQYNSLLVNEEFIKITKLRLNGKERNLYSIQEV